MSMQTHSSANDPRLDSRSEAQRREELARDIVSAALLRGRFVRKDGVESDYFIDKYLFEAQPAILRRIASLLAGKLPTETQRLVAHEIGPLPVATAVSLETGLPLSIAHEKSEGLDFSGELHPGDVTVLVEDVVSTGRRALSVVAPLQALRMNVVAVLAVIDREEGGSAAIGDAGVSFDPLYRLGDLYI